MDFRHSHRKPFIWPDARERYLPTWRELQAIFRELQPLDKDGLWAEWAARLAVWNLRDAPTYSVLRRFKTAAAWAAKKAHKPETWASFLDVLKDEEDTFLSTGLPAGSEITIQDGVIYRVCEAAADYCEKRIPQDESKAAFKALIERMEHSRQTPTVGWPVLPQSVEPLPRTTQQPTEKTSTEAATENNQITPRALRDCYLAQFPNERIKKLDICWAAGQRYCEWKRWIRNAIKKGSTADLAFRAILTGGKKPGEYRKQPRPSGWK